MNKARILIDAGGTQIKIGLGIGDSVLKRTFIPTPSKEGFLSGLEKVKDIINNWLPDGKMGGFGLAFAGIVDYNQSKVISVNGKYEDALDFNFLEWVTSNFSCQFALENDVRAALIGEWKYGAGIGSDNIVMLTLGTGIGGSALINGKILRGKHNQAGCLIGHFTIDYNGSVCNCGNKGCAETVGSSWKLPELVKNHPRFTKSNLFHEKLIDFEALFRNALAGDKLAIEIREKCMDSWAAAAVNAIHAYDPEIVIIGGGVMQSSEIIIPYLQNYIDKYAWTPWGKIQLKPALLGNDAGMWGMNYLLSEKIKA